jgi:hypothetical protein
VHATFYISDPSLIGSKFFDRFPEVTKLEGAGTKRKATGFVLTTNWGKIRLKFMPEREVQQHMSGFTSFLSRALSDPDARVYALNRLNYVRLCMACTFETADGTDAAVGKFLQRLNRGLNGVLVTDAAIFDFDGTKLWKAT